VYDGFGAINISRNSKRKRKRKRKKKRKRKRKRNKIVMIRIAQNALKTRWKTQKNVVRETFALYILKTVIRM
jgi:hypothetical protein